MSDFGRRSGSASGAPRTAKGRFFYGVIHTQHDCNLGQPGIEAARVYTVRYKDVSALVSPYPHSNIRMLRKNLLPYQLVLKEAGERYTTLPAKFGQIADDEEEVLRVLRDNYLTLKKEIERLQEKKEYGLTVSWAGDDFLTHLKEVDGELKAEASKLYNRGAPPTRQELIELGMTVNNSIKAFKRMVSGKLLETLGHLPSEFRMEEPVGDKMMTNASFLVHKDKGKEFLEAVEKVANHLGNGYELRLSGPWVPFSFVGRIDLF